MRLSVLTIAPLFTLCCCAYDPVSDMCARWDHQSVVKNNRLYIDGGTETFGALNTTGPYVLGWNKYLISVDLSESWNWKTNISITSIDKTANPETGTKPPSLLRGAMYQGGQSDPKLYIYAGTKSQLNSSFDNSDPDPSIYSLWSFDTSSKTWNQYDMTAASPLRPSRAGYAEAPDQSLGFWLDGQADRGSSTLTTSMGDSTLGLKGRIVINMTDPAKTARNLSTASLDSTNGIVSGSLTYLPYVGEHGALVALGGMSRPTTGPTNANGTLIPFDTVDIFDIASYYAGGDGIWYKQNTSGTPPSPRIEFCVVSVSAPDRSSHNLYLYGGRDPIRNILFDDIYILSLPSFTWMQFFQGESPRYGHTCHLVAKRQLLTVGGSLSTNITSKCDWETKGVAIMDLSTKTWGSVYNAYAAPYKVPQDIVAKIGGSPDGGAKLKAPGNGFSDPGLSSLFSRSPADPLQVKASHRKKVGAIVGGVIGAFLGVALIILGIIFMCMKKRRAQTDAINELEHVQTARFELDQKNPPVELPVPPSELGADTYSSELAAQEIAELEGDLSPSGSKCKDGNRSNSTGPLTALKRLSRGSAG